jgi:signal transduction histidine kinase
LKKYKLRTKLSISYILVALFLVALISLLTNVFLEKHFQNYIIKQQETKNIDIVNLINQQYNDADNSWRETVVQNIGINALEQGLIVKVRDKQGNIVWDATVHNSGLCTQMISHMSQNMISRYPDFKGEYKVNNYPLKRGPALVGKVEIGYYGPFYLTDNDLAFINTLNKMLGSVAAFSLLLALIAGALTAKRLSAPISKAVAAARDIGQGHYNNRITDISDTIEINELTSTVNNLAEDLDKQDKLRKRLTADVAHELRTPLATLQSHMEAMIDGIWEPDSSRLKSCHEEIMRINRMVGDLENLARYESENLVLNKETFDLSELAQYIVKNYEAEFVNKNIELSLQKEASLVYADRDKISQVIVNLLSNALKYTAGGSVQITVGHYKNQVVLKIKDTGIGISSEDLEHIFARFYRVDKSRSRENGGSGIGLAIVKAIIDAHGGRVSVTSTINEGTEFTVALPEPQLL